MDSISKEKRSILMSRIQSKDTKPEILVRKYLFSKGLRFRKNVKKMPGTPDIVLPKYNTIIFIHGCFWHGHTCRQGRLPTSNMEFWQNKITNNKKRDIQKIELLEKEGWKVIVIWQCELKNKVKSEETLNSLYLLLTNNIED